MSEIVRKSLIGGGLRERVRFATLSETFLYYNFFIPRARDGIYIGKVLGSVANRTRPRKLLIVKGLEEGARRGIYTDLHWRVSACGRMACGGLRMSGAGGGVSAPSYCNPCLHACARRAVSHCRPHFGHAVGTGLRPPAWIFLDIAALRARSTRCCLVRGI